MPPARVTSGCTISTPPFVDQPLEVGQRRLLLAAGDRRVDGGGQRGILAVVVGPERLLDPERAVLLHAPHAVDRLARALPADADVDHQVEVVAAGLARRGHQRDVELGRAARAAPSRA